MRKKPNAESLGKIKIKVNGQNIFTTAYRDYESTFILVKSKRIKVNDSIINKHKVWSVME